MRLFVGNLAFSVSDKELRAHFETNGFKPTDLRVMTDRETGRSRGFAFVTFGTEDQANNAISKLDGSLINGREVRLSVANDRPQRPGNGPVPTQQRNTYNNPSPNRELGRLPTPPRAAKPEPSFNQDPVQTHVAEKKFLPKKSYGKQPVYDEWGSEGKGGDRRRNDRVRGKRRRDQEEDDSWD